MSAAPEKWPKLSMPEAETGALRRAYRNAKVILEFGSGGSTVYATRQPGKLVLSVESDRSWALGLQCKLDSADHPSEAILYHVDIGQTGRWGRPKTDSAWRHFHRYPTSIWVEPFFRHPDTILIDGRLRPACFVNACLRIKSPVTILFDDYRDRPMYHVVEELLKPAELVGRMGVFHVEPREWPSWAEELLRELCTLVSVEAEEVDYSKPADIPFLQSVKSS